ncbi:MAG: hypothetical protein QOE90_1664 [Thermoplasmata archaeon]|nr:hypothetical protein [Thermoplasmata archaeon]
MPLSTAKYHIEALWRSGRVVLRSDGRYRRIFPAGYDPAMMGVASAMHRRVARQVLVHVAGGEPWTRRSLSAATGVSGSNLGGALTHLCRAGLLARELRGGRFLYRAAGPVRPARR